MKGFKEGDIVKISGKPEDFSTIFDIKEVTNLIGEVSIISNEMIIVTFTEGIKLLKDSASYDFHLIPAHKNIIKHVTQREQFLYELFGSTCLKEKDK